MPQTTNRTLCCAHAEQARKQGRALGPFIRNRGACAEAGCRGTAFYAASAAIEKPSMTQPGAALGSEEKSSAPEASAAPEPPGRYRRVVGPMRSSAKPARPVPCDGSEACPHCFLSRITPVSAYCIPPRKRP